MYHPFLMAHCLDWKWNEVFNDLCPFIWGKSWEFLIFTCIHHSRRLSLSSEYRRFFFVFKLDLNVSRAYYVIVLGTWQRLLTRQVIFLIKKIFNRWWPMSWDFMELLMHLTPHWEFMLPNFQVINYTIHNEGSFLSIFLIMRLVSSFSKPDNNWCLFNYKKYLHWLIIFCFIGYP